MYFKNVDFPDEGSAKVAIAATETETRTNAGLPGEADSFCLPHTPAELQYAIEHFVVRVSDEDLAFHCVPGETQERHTLVIRPEVHKVGKTAGLLERK